MNLSPPDITAVALMALACWRVASLLTVEAGPWRVFLKLRERVGIVHDEVGDVGGTPDGFLGGLLSCVWCMTFWLAPIAWLVWTVAPLAIIVLAVAALAVVVETVADGIGGHDG